MLLSINNSIAMVNSDYSYPNEKDVRFLQSTGCSGQSTWVVSFKRGNMQIARKARLQDGATSTWK